MSNKPLPSHFSNLGSSETKLDMPTLGITRKSKGTSSHPKDRETAYRMDSIEKVVRAFDEKERLLPR